jgi:hypothetical protein
MTCLKAKAIVAVEIIVNLTAIRAIASDMIGTSHFESLTVGAIGVASCQKLNESLQRTCLLEQNKVASALNVVHARANFTSLFPQLNESYWSLQTKVSNLTFVEEAGSAGSASARVHL